MKISQNTFDGLAFPVARVRYAGPTEVRGSRFNATMKRGEDSYRIARSYRYDEPQGAGQAVHAARLCLANYLEENDRDETVADYVAVPGEYDVDTYVFVFVPARFFS
jgi:hypothetical protein